MQRQDADTDADVPPDAPAAEPVGASSGPGDPPHEVEPERAPRAEDAQDGAGGSSTPPLDAEDADDAARQDVVAIVFVSAEAPEPEGVQDVATSDETGPSDVSPPAYDFDESDVGAPVSVGYEVEGEPADDAFADPDAALDDFDEEEPSIEDAREYPSGEEEV